MSAAFTNTGSFQRPTGGEARTGSDEEVSKAIQQALEDVELWVETEDESLNDIIDGRAKSSSTSVARPTTERSSEKNSDSTVSKLRLPTWTVSSSRTSEEETDPIPVRWEAAPAATD